MVMDHESHCLWGLRVFRAKILENDSFPSASTPPDDLYCIKRRSDIAKMSIRKHVEDPQVNGESSKRQRVVDREVNLPSGVDLEVEHRKYQQAEPYKHAVLHGLISDELVRSSDHCTTSRTLMAFV